MREGSSSGAPIASRRSRVACSIFAVRDPLQQIGQRFVVRLDRGQQRLECRRVRTGERGERIEGREDQPLLVLGHLDILHRHGLLLRFQRQLKPEMPIEQIARGLVHDDVLHPADLSDHREQLIVLVLGMSSPV